MIARRRFIAISAAWAAASPARADEARGREWRGRALGAEAQVTLAGPEALTAAMVARIEALLRRIEAEFSLHDPGSALARLNRDGALDGPSSAMLDVLAASDAAHRATAGRFDPTVQPLWRALADGGDAVAARRLVGWPRVRFDPARVRLGRGQALTLNGIAQGFAADRVRDLLARAGFTRVLVDIGEFAALGGPWRLGIADPEYGLVATRTLANGAIATSSPGALRLAGGEGHILGPGGEPVRWSTVSVEAGSATLADALSTAFCLMRASEIRAATARAAGVRRVLLVDGDGGVTSL